MICETCKAAADANLPSLSHCLKDGTFCTCQHHPITDLGLNVVGVSFSS